MVERRRVLIFCSRDVLTTQLEFIDVGFGLKYEALLLTELNRDGE